MILKALKLSLLLALAPMVAIDAAEAKPVVQATKATGPLEIGRAHV